MDVYKEDDSFSSSLIALFSTLGGGGIENDLFIYFYRENSIGKHDYVIQSILALKSLETVFIHFWLHFGKICTSRLSCNLNVIFPSLCEALNGQRVKESD